VPYSQVAEIKDWQGHYQEMINPGAFTETLRSMRPRMFFEHGKDARTGLTPIGSFERVWEEDDGVHVHGELFENQLTQPLIDAARAGELASWSGHFQTPSDKSWEKWERAQGWNVRIVNRALLPEISLVNRGAYQTTLSIRSALSDLPDLTPPERVGSVTEGPNPTSQSAQRRHLWAMRIQLRNTDGTTQT